MLQKWERGGDGNKLLHKLHAKQPQGNAADLVPHCAPLKEGLHGTKDKREGECQIGRQAEEAERRWEAERRMAERERMRDQ